MSARSRRRLRSCACCSSRARRCRSARYSYSQGLESAVDSGTRARRRRRAQRWIGDMLDARAARTAKRAVLVAAAARARARRLGRVRATGTRGSAPRARRRELRAETRADGRLARQACCAISTSLDATRRDAIARDARRSRCPARSRSRARAFGDRSRRRRSPRISGRWLENQVLAALKAVPLGQVAGQRMLLALGGAHSAPSSRARATADDDDVASFAPGLALASARHETQYSRLFRSMMPMRPNRNPCASASAARSAPARPR